MADWLNVLNEEERQREHARKMGEQAARQFVDMYSKDIVRVFQETCDYLNSQNPAPFPQRHYEVSHGDREGYASYEWIVPGAIQLFVKPDGLSWPEGVKGSAMVICNAGRQHSVRWDGPSVPYSFIEGWLKPRILESLRSKKNLG